MKKQCQSCGASFSCRSDRIESCWCSELPAIFSSEEGDSDCLCPDCLSRSIKERIRLYVDNITVDEALHANRAKGLPLTPVIEGVDFYMEGGFFVYTAWHHLKRGYCCKSGCRHCPYK